MEFSVDIFRKLICFFAFNAGTLEIDLEIENKAPKLPDFGIEYAKIEDSCTGCQQKIKAQEIRIMNVVYDTSHNTAFDGKLCL